MDSGRSMQGIVLWVTSFRDYFFWRLLLLEVVFPRDQIIYRVSSSPVDIGQ